MVPIKIYRSKPRAEVQLGHKERDGGGRSDSSPSLLCGLPGKL